MAPLTTGVIQAIIREVSQQRVGRGRYAGSGGGFSATGGNIADGLTPGNGYKYHTFSSTANFTVTGSGNIEVLMVAGGGGGGDGGGGNGGGGGAGGLRYYPSLPVSSGTYLISVGGGGNAASSFAAPGTAGTPTTAFGKTATGGGHPNYNYSSVNNGGSGGSTGYNVSVGSGNAGGNDPQASPISEGNPGGPGGGGGAGDAGQPSRGGNGLQFSNFTGPLIGIPALAPLSGYYSGGGGSGFESSNSTPGGLGGGGNGASRYPGNGINNTAGTQYSGGGGGGTSTNGTTPAKAGGSGLVVIRYLAT
jgi:hypothetical protein